MTIPQLKKNLQENSIGNLYLFVGEEAFLIEKYVATIKSKILTGVLDDFNCFNFDGEISFALLEDSILQPPQMSEKKLIIAKISGLIKKDSKEMQKILNDIPDYAVVILVEESLTKVSKPLLKIIEEKGDVIEFKKQEKRDLCLWATQIFATNGKRISARAVELLVEICEKDMTRIKNEIEKLSSATNLDEIDESLINSMVSANAEYKTYELADKLLNKDAKAVYEMLKEFQLNKDAPTAIIAGIFSQAYLLLMVCELKQEKHPDPYEFIPANKKWLARKINPNNLDYKKLKTAVSLCCDYDYKIKSGLIEPYAALDIIVAQLLL